MSTNNVNIITTRSKHLYTDLIIIGLSLQPLCQKSLNMHNIGTTHKQNIMYNNIVSYNNVLFGFTRSFSFI